MGEVSDLFNSLKSPWTISVVGVLEFGRRKPFVRDKNSYRNLKTHSQTALVPCQG